MTKINLFKARINLTLILSAIHTNIYKTTKQRINIKTKRERESERGERGEREERGERSTTTSHQKQRIDVN